jgi:DNA-binding XRE family transcriptional regulator
VAANNVRRMREALMMSKAELARKAGLSTLTIDRIEAGKASRLDTKRKILHALGLKVSDKEAVFGTEAVAPDDVANEPQSSHSSHSSHSSSYSG